jgi:glutamyl-tRNA reductase
MHLLVEGLNYRGAPLSVRERVFLSGEALRGWLERLGAKPALTGGAILSTCNRTEFYLTAEDPGRAQAEMEILTRDFEAPGEWQRHRYRLQGPEALEHLFKVPSGLDSAIIGEAQILGQFKAALEVARAAGTVDSDLDFLMRRAITVAKRVRSETGVGRNPVGFGHAALVQARAVFGNLGGRSALMVGAGKMASSTARLLAADGIERIHFSTRSPAKAMELAAEMPGGVVALTVPFSHLDQIAAEVDMIICSTSAPDYIFTREMVQGYMRRRKRRPLFLLDLAVPRDIDPEAAAIEDAYLYNVDDLAGIVEQGIRKRISELPAAEAIIREEIDRTGSDLVQARAKPVIASLSQRAEELRALQLRQSLPAGLDLAQREQLEQLTRSLTAKLLHGPIRYLREHADDETVARMAREMFDLGRQDEES